jgi:hypothetical protein
MNVQEKPPELNGNPCAACTDEQPGLRAERSPTFAHTTLNAVADPEADRSALTLVETENAGLRRLIVQLIQENQHLRQQVNTAKNEHSTQSSIAS